MLSSRGYTPFLWTFSPEHWWFNVVAMTRRRWFDLDPSKELSDSFWEYLEGFASTNDIYSLCTRRPLGHSEMRQVADDFWDSIVDLTISREEYRILHESYPSGDEWQKTNEAEEADQSLNNPAKKLMSHG